MSQFYASIKGNRGEATRQGTKASGIYGHIRGWHVGARVEMSFEDGEDVCRVWLTSGSGGAGRSTLLGKFRVKDLNGCK